MRFFVYFYPVGGALHGGSDGGKVDVGFTFTGGNQTVFLPVIRRLRPLDIDFVGRFHYIVESDKSKLDVLTKFPDGTHVAVIHPGEFGLTGKVLETTGESSSARLQELLADGLEAYQPEDKNPRTHVRNGQRSGKQWETDLPVTGARASERPGNQ